MNEAEKKYHQSRRMFFLINNELVIPPANSDKSHIEWLMENGWSQKEAKKIIEAELRGVVNPDGNIRFYVGENWEVSEEIEIKFFKILPKLVEEFNLDTKVRIEGGVIKQEIGKFWPPKKVYGTVGDLLKREMVVLVDEDDKEVGVEEKLEAHKNSGIRHRAFSILIFNDKNEVMLQQRALDKYHAGGLWTNTCCSHPRPGENIESAAHRRLMEEMGFDTKLKEIFSFKYTATLDQGLTENEFDHVFFGTYNLEPKINSTEVESWKWICKADLNKDIKTNPQNYTPWFRVIFNRIKAKII